MVAAYSRQYHQLTDRGTALKYNQISSRQGKKLKRNSHQSSACICDSRSRRPRSHQKLYNRMKAASRVLALYW